MIVELTRYEPESGRHYCGPDGRILPAIDRIRLDCVELFYTKIRGTTNTELAELRQQLIGSYATVWYQDAAIEQHEWVEAILLLYRGIHDQRRRGVAAVGYQLTVYGVEPPVELQAQLGPKNEPPEEHDAETP